MNNKKLFKGALVLFASILMAVSCSAGDKTGGDGSGSGNGNGGTGGDSTGGDKVTAITDNQIQTALIEGLGATIKADSTGGDGKEFTITGATYSAGTLTIVSTVGTSAGQLNQNPSKAEVAKAIVARKNELTGALDKIGITLSDISRITVVSDSGTDGTFTMPITVKSGYSLPSGTTANIIIKLTATGKTWDA